MTPLEAVAAVCLAVAALRFALWWRSEGEPSNYERDEIPPPERTVSPQDWRRM